MLVTEKKLRSLIAQATQQESQHMEAALRAAGAKRLAEHLLTELLKPEAPVEDAAKEEPVH